MLIRPRGALPMNLKKLPPSMLVLLGLGTEACAPCLSTTPCLSTFDSASTYSSSTSGGSSEVDTGPCLSPPLDSSTGPITGPTGSGTTGSSGTSMDSGTGTGTGTGSDTGTGSSTGMGSDDTSTGPCLAPAGAAPDAMLAPPVSPPEAYSAAETREAALQRVLDRHALPDDVASRLRARLDD